MSISLAKLSASKRRCKTIARKIAAALPYETSIRTCQSETCYLYIRFFNKRGFKQQISIRISEHKWVNRHRAEPDYQILLFGSLTDEQVISIGIEKAHALVKSYTFG